MSVSVKVNNITNNFYSDEWYTEVEIVKKMHDLLGVEGGQQFFVLLILINLYMFSMLLNVVIT